MFLSSAQAHRSKERVMKNMHVGPCGESWGDQMWIRISRVRSVCHACTRSIYREWLRELPVSLPIHSPPISPYKPNYNPFHLTLFWGWGCVVGMAGARGTTWKYATFCNEPWARGDGVINDPVISPGFKSHSSLFPPPFPHPHSYSWNYLSLSTHIQEDAPWVSHW